jgi:heptosyltransferase-2
MPDTGQSSHAPPSSNVRGFFDLIQIAPATTASPAQHKAANDAALGILVRMTPRKRKLIRVAEAILRPLVRLVDRFRSSRQSSAGEPQKILVLEYWNIGDIAMELPFLESLRLQYPAAHIAILTSPKCVPLLRDQGLVDEIIEVKVPWAQHYSRWAKYNPFTTLWFDFFRTLGVLKAKKFDLAFAARADLRENFLLWLVNVTRRVAYSFGGGDFLLTDAVTPDLTRPHFSSTWLRLLEHVGKPPIATVPHLRLPAEEHEWAGNYLKELGIGPDNFIVAINPGARNPVRQWGEDRFRAVAKRLVSDFPVRIVWFQDPGQPSASGDNSQFAVVSLPLRKFMAVLSRCQLAICNDSGPMHLSAALDVPVVGIFGPGEPLWWAPLGEGHRVVIRSEFWCRPCFDYCLFDQPHCLRLVSVDSVYDAASDKVRELLVGAEVSNGLRAERSAHLRTLSTVEGAAD